jgi:tetratricopeptide (TPR) repeat protein
VRPGQAGGGSRFGGGSGSRFGDRSRPGQRPWTDKENRGNRGASNYGAANGDRRAVRRQSSDGPVLIPDSITEDQVSREVKAELRGLPADLATTVGRYLVASELAKDPEQAYRYAQAARDKAARIGVVREVTGIAAYRSGRWAEALAELRAARRLTGRGDYLPLMADSERALGRLDRALDLTRGDEAKRLPRAAQIELRIVESGIRRDQGLADAAVLALQVPELSDGRLRPWSARLLYAYGDALLAAGRPAEARNAFSRAVVADEDEETDALSRLDELDGITVDDLEDDDDLEAEEAEEAGWAVEDEAVEDDEDENDEADWDDEAEDEEGADEAVRVDEDEEAEDEGDADQEGADEAARVDEDEEAEDEGDADQEGADKANRADADAEPESDKPEPDANLAPNVTVLNVRCPT